MVSRYGLKAYKEGWSVYTTLDSKSQNIAKNSLLDNYMHMTKDMAGKNLINYSDIFNEQEILSLSLS